MNGTGCYIYFDGAPAPQGNYGQIIAFQHDPDVVFYLAPDFLTFFRQSNDAFEMAIANGETAESMFLDPPF